MGVSPEVTYTGPVFPLIWWDKGLSCWWPPEAPLGTAGLRREPKDESRAKDGEVS